MTRMTISNLQGDLVTEILIRVPLKYMRAVRLTCKNWNDLSKSQSFTKMHIDKAAKKGESQMIVMMGYTLYLMSIVINGDLSTEYKGKLTRCLNEQVKISEFYHCEGLLLCILKNDSRFVVWNPYLGQPRWIEPRNTHRPNSFDQFSYALGYKDDNNKSCRSHKLLRFTDYCYCRTHEKQLYLYEIYDFDSDLWATLDVTPHWRVACGSGVSLKGNSYWCAAKRSQDVDHEVFTNQIICFDFAKESFGPLMPLPLICGYHDFIKLSCVREEKLALLLQHDEINPYELDLWITSKIETDELSWSKFLRVESPFDILVPYITESFFIDEEKKVAIGFDDSRSHRIIILGEANYSKTLDLVGEYGDQNCMLKTC